MLHSLYVYTIGCLMTYEENSQSHFKANCEYLHFLLSLCNYCNCGSWKIALTRTIYMWKS